MSLNRPTVAGRALRRCAQLVTGRDAVGDEVFACPACAAQRDRCVGVGRQRTQPLAVGAERVGEDVRVESVVLVAGGTVSTTKILDLVRGDHHHGDASLEQCVNDRPVGSFDRGLSCAVPGQERHQLPQSLGGVFEHGAGDLAASVVDDADRVVVAGPVDSRGDLVQRDLGQFISLGSAGRLHVSLLAASPRGEAPSSHGGRGAGTCLPVRSLIGARPRFRDWRSALSTVHTSRATTRPCRSHAGHQQRQASRAVTWRHPGCIGIPSENADTRKVVQ